MSLLNLLSVGNSFSTIEDHPNRFKMLRENLLPHFGDLEVDEANDASAQTHGNHCHGCIAEAGLTSARELSEATANLPEGARSAAKSEANSPANPMNAYPQGRWTTKRTFFITGKASAPTEAQPVQCELPWEDIPVMRNDLNETDVEVVQAARQPASAESSKPVPSEPSRSGRMLGRLRGRLFPVEKL